MLVTPRLRKGGSLLRWQSSVSDGGNSYSGSSMFSRPAVAVPHVHVHCEWIVMCCMAANSCLMIFSVDRNSIQRTELQPALKRKWRALYIASKSWWASDVDPNTPRPGARHADGLF